MNDRHELGIFLILGILGAAVFGGFYADFPTSTVPINHAEEDAYQSSREFLQMHGYNVSGFDRSTTYTTDSATSVYLQRTLPWRQAKDTIIRYDVHYWETWYYQPLGEEEFIVAIDPVDGELVWFDHYLPDEAPGATLSKPAARTKAEQFLDAHGHNPEQYELVEYSVTNHPNRRDHWFTWQHTDRRVNNAPYTVDVEIQGERIGYYDAYLDIPDSFYHNYEIQQARSDLLGGVGFLGLSALLGIAALVYSLRSYKDGRFDTRFALGLGGAVAVLSFISVLNTLPGILSFAPTILPTWQFIALVVVSAAIGALIAGGVTVIAAGAGKRLAADVLEQNVVDRLSTIWTDAETRSRVTFGLARGVFLAWILLGFYTAFYVIGTTYFDVWLPADTPYATAMATYIPAVLALTVGGIAAISEETMYRLFAIPLCKRYLKYTALAVVVPAFIWGLGHSGYAVLPYYVRAVEVTLIGIILGGVFLRYGLLTTAVAHFSLNALIVGIPLFLTGAPGLFVQGVVAVVIAFMPLLVAGGLVVLRGTERTSISS